MTEKINELYEWFWDYGINRKDEHQISGEWITDLYTVKFFNEQVDKNLKSNKKSIALWGPSQSGKSTFLSKVIDGDDNTSALMWNDDNPFLFNGKIRVKTPSLNPYNVGSDGTSCVTKYFIPENIKEIDTDYPVEIKFLNLSDLFLMLTVGYRGRFGNSSNSWYIDEFEEFLKEYNDDENVDTVLSKDATELIVNLIFTIDKLIKMDDFTFINLTKDNNWKNRFRDRILLNRKLCSDINTAKVFVKNILWKNIEENIMPSINKMHTIFDDLIDTYYNYRDIFKDKKLICNLDFASYVINMSAAKTKKDDYGNTLIEPRVNNIIGKINYIENDGSIKICSNENQSFINSLEEFIKFQVLVKEIDIPLNKDFLSNKTLFEETTVSDFFSKHTILDFPGLSNFGKADANIDTDLLEVAKYGKALTAIYPYAESLEITSLLLTLPVSQPINQADTIRLGIDYINNPIQYFLSTEDLDISIPIHINYTFFIKALSDFLIANEVTNSLDGYETNLDLGGILDNSFSFATNYHWFNRGLDKDIQELMGSGEYTDFVNNFMKVNWVKRRFKSEDEQECLKSLLDKILTDPNGGVFWLLTLMSYNLEGIDVEKRYTNFKEALTNKFKELIIRVMPVNEVNAQEIDGIKKKFIEALNNKYRYFKEQRESFVLSGQAIEDDTDSSDTPLEKRIEAFEEDVTYFYKNTLNFLVCKQTIFDNDRISILSYYRKKIQYFKNDTDKFKILKESNLNHREASILLAILEKKFTFNKEIQKFISENFGDLREINSNQDRYISQYISNNIYKPKSLHDKNRIQHCQKIFVKNREFPHFSLINILLDYKIKEIIKEITELISGDQDINREQLDGDTKLLKIQDSINKEEE